MARLGEADLERAAVAERRIVLDHPRVDARRARRLGAAVARSVHHDDDLERPAVLAHGAVEVAQRLGNGVALVAHGHDDAHRRSGRRRSHLGCGRQRVFPRSLACQT